jgi:hypothetical protein
MLERIRLAKGVQFRGPNWRVRRHGREGGRMRETLARFPRCRPIRRNNQV